MRIHKKYVAVLAGLVLVASAAYGALGNKRVPTEFYTGHTHHDHGTQGAPEHSGGTNKQGCHNASVPYHCH